VQREAAFHTDFVDFGRAICNDRGALDREWLLTNGLGSYAMGTIALARTRRYHGVLVVAGDSPADRTMLVGAMTPTVTYRGRSHPLYTGLWTDGSTQPMGHLLLQQFRLEGSIPVWRWAVSDALIELRMWMVHGEHTTVMEWTAREASNPVDIAMDVLVDRRPHHALAAADIVTPACELAPRGLRIRWPGPETATSSVWVQGDALVPAPDGSAWRNFLLTEERARGYDFADSLVRAAEVRIVLEPGTSSTLTVSTVPKDAKPAAANRAVRQRHESTLLAQCGLSDARRPVGQLCLAADQFVVRRRVGQTDGMSIIAGYPWFGDWGRDTMLSLPGLLLATGRLDDAQQVIRTWCGAIDGGMLPNRFPDRAGDPTEFNSVDAPLAMISAVDDTMRAGAPDSFLKDVWPAMAQVIERYTAGTRHGIAVDAADGLLRAGEAGVQLTWMDAKCGDRVITPRIGKPVEVNALWHHALHAMARLAPRAGADATPFAAAAARAADSFSRFWNTRTACCFDVIDGPDGADASIRPNQLFAVSLPDSPLPEGQRRAVVDLCMSRLWTPVGVRTLDAADPRYIGQYAGTPEQRDSAYHMGTAWPWLFGPLLTAHLSVHRNAEAVMDFLLPYANHLREAGLGSVSEVHDGDPPHAPGGCPMQAWSVAAALKVWRLCDRLMNGTAAQDLPATSLAREAD
jgi:predicted glycogen debranching enzyme